MIALVIFTRRTNLMGIFVNKPLTNVVAYIGTAIVLMLNAILILDTLGIHVAGY